MLFKELNRIQTGNHNSIPQNPYAKLKSRRLRRAEARQAKLGARNLGASVNKNTSTIKQAKKVI